MGSNPCVNQESVINARGGASKALLYDQGRVTPWDAAEQKILEEGIVMFASDPVVTRYTKIANQLERKTARDVAQRHMWMIVQERKSVERWKEDGNFSKKKKGRETVTDPQPVETCDASLYEAIDGPIGKLLQINSKILNDISFSEVLQSFDNARMPDYWLLLEVRENILQIYNNIMSDSSPVSAQMPPLPPKIIEMLNAILVLGNHIPVHRNMN
ncbi:uncharacterized protein M6B38_128575 [Iris pallida]|uniref:Uncharacterized protein n=1 Tax=Iris pallida TaxID=29817 RepID=A0AAX6G4F2_IRIPA|nr:uncharacterized protein M6B38_128575 [Iris pallida]